MRILLFNPSHPPMRCGVGDYARRLAAALREEGHDTTVVTSTAARAGPRVLALLPEWDVRSYVRRLPRFSRPKPDLVITQYPSVLPGRRARLLFLLPGLAKATLGGPRVVVIVHEFARGEQAGNRWMALAFRAADGIGCVSEMERAAVVERYPWTRTKATVLPVASNIPAVRTDAEPTSALRRRLGTPLLVHFGLLSSPEKGFDDLLDALPRVEGVLAATGELDPDNAYHRQITERIERLGIGERIRWLGYLTESDVARHLAAADAVVLPFRRGIAAQNSSLMGSLVNGAVVVTTSGEETPEWLVDRESAVLVPPGDPKALAAGINRALANPARLRAGARALAPRFDWGAVARAVVALGITEQRGLQGSHRS